RLTRLLLHARDLIGGDTLPVTQQFLGQMLGVRRSSVSFFASTLQKAGKIKYSWGRVQVIDLKALNAGACECYRAVKTNSRRLLIGAR
ncbi:MAG TPA: helix-turn-helix domain-containing protein, partial [Blastocatellia bacterium]|nr:helix-turn-helix domain-containing protein [Blastocatellia bacterium]